MFTIHNPWHPKFWAAICLICLSILMFGQDQSQPVILAAPLPQPLTYENQAAPPLPATVPLANMQLDTMPLAAVLEGNIVPTTENVLSEGLVGFNIEIRNSGEDSAQDVKLEVVLPLGLLLDSPNSSEWKPIPERRNAYERTVGMLDANTSRSFSLITRVAAVFYGCIEKENVPMPTTPTLRLIAEGLEPVEIAPETPATPPSPTTNTTLDGEIIAMKLEVSPGEELPFCMPVKNLSSTAAEKLWIEVTLSEFALYDEETNDALGWEPSAGDRTYRRTFERLDGDGQMAVSFLSIVNPDAPVGTRLEACVTFGAENAETIIYCLGEPTPTPTNTATPTETWTPGPTPTSTTTNTPVNTPTSTATHTPTETPSPTFTPVNTSTSTPTEMGSDSFEPDNRCNQATLIETNREQHKHSFYRQADEDWTYFTAEEGRDYMIEVRVPPKSNADVSIELHKECDSGADQTQDMSFSPGVRLLFEKAPNDGPVYLRTFNHSPTTFGSQTQYSLSVWRVPLPDEEVPVGALIIVAGRLKEKDRLQKNIHNVTDRVYQVWTKNGYGSDRIRYLATDLTLDPTEDRKADVHGFPTVENLREAIVEWAAERVDADRALTLYMMDHGDKGKLYLDEPRNEILRSEDLNSWLGELEAKIPGLSINVIIEACNSGSFINDPSHSISGPNRLVITSTGSISLAYASRDGAHFSDIFLDSLEKGHNVALAFEDAMLQTQNVYWSQTAWLDDDGDGIPNEEKEDGALARQRSFVNAGSFPGLQKWSPYIVQAEIRPENQTGHHVYGAATTNRQVIWAEVRDDGGSDGIKQVWAVIYPPSWQPPTRSDEMVPEPAAPFTLIEQGNHEYRAGYGEFTEIGTYRIVIHAEDEDGLRSPPLELRFVTGSQLYLPIITR